MNVEEKNRRKKQNKKTKKDFAGRYRNKNEWMSKGGKKKYKTKGKVNSWVNMRYKRRQSFICDTE